MWQTPAEIHAALNDLPVVLLILSVAFDIAGSLTKRESLKAAGFWTLVAGAAGALAALFSGLRAEATVEHGGTVHLVMERHETLAITVTVLFVLLAAWRIWRRGPMASKERQAYLAAVVFSALLVFWTAHVGATIVYRHGGGLPTDVLEGALEERTVGHTHGPNEEQGDEAVETGTAVDADHSDPPGTPAHEH